MINRRKFIAHVKQNGCSLKRHGGKHDVYQSDTDPSKCSTIPRHNEINPYTAKGICKALGIPEY